ncbi:uncharacterized protein LOC123521158 [Echinops telfairi]|uniref:Uncharacterized protein LOC123521158 n=1 Tax=Echinops telfairi TaxID=9371 RepID=A0AC55CNE7_ECHTE|nr:uncharacterized protein LOC123521158 [Echinops telfairi]
MVSTARCSRLQVSTDRRLSGRAQLRQEEQGPADEVSLWEGRDRQGRRPREKHWGPGQAQPANGQGATIAPAHTDQPNSREFQGTWPFPRPPRFEAMQQQQQQQQRQRTGHMDSEGEGAGGGSKKGSVEDVQGSSGDPESGDVAEGAVAQTQGARPAPVPGGDQAPGAAPRRSLLIEFILTVPFQSCTEADIALRTLFPVVERLLGMVGKEISVNGSNLIVHLTADDSSSLQMAIATMVSHVKLLLRAG